MTSRETWSLDEAGCSGAEGDVLCGRLGVTGAGERGREPSVGDAALVASLGLDR
jgi:hypothetical protein